MKKIMLAGIVAMASMSLVACDRTDRTTSMEADEDNKVVVDRDSVPTEYEVTETVVEYDTTTKKKTVDADDAKHDNKKDRDKNRDN
ncbi:hypothetical protein [Pontibacter chinhatensis]|uniref:Lipoprotein n=1 Tax=Pontibacter chinhatensis TaxID=1436961 RepID=A0A1I2MV81_9BACT|nr:hypothetical protein [Pontibacter chinhatensis]SFF95353.1 hypothetical protein SAMN05421739_101491 [Pontibacter chinhatensis]